MRKRQSQSGITEDDIAKFSARAQAEIKRQLGETDTIPLTEARQRALGAMTRAEKRRADAAKADAGEPTMRRLRGAYVHVNPPSNWEGFGSGNRVKANDFVILLGYIFLLIGWLIEAVGAIVVAIGSVPREIGRLIARSGREMIGD